MAQSNKLRLGVNIDHVATVRNARGSAYPDPVRAAKLAEAAGADGITAHLREDRRHIRDADIDGLMAALTTPLNFEMAATIEMQSIALAHKPHAVCIVPEKREERTTEGGLDVAGDDGAPCASLSRPSLRGWMSRSQCLLGMKLLRLSASARIGAAVVELHTGAYCDYHYEGNFAKRDAELAALIEGATLAHSLGLEVHAGHGLTFETVKPIAAIPEVMELNIGHFLMAESLFIGMEAAILQMRALMDEVRG